MRPPRWPIRGMVPLVVAGGMVAGTTVAAQPSLTATVSPPPCPPVVAPATVGPLAGAWWRLEAALDATGELAGHRLLASAPGRQTFELTLPPESFASGPRNGVVLVGGDDGAVSTLARLDLAAGCRTVVAVVPDVVRRAVESVDGSSIYEFRIERRTRRDLGVWRRQSGTGQPDLQGHQVLEPIAADARFGPTWTTTLDWSDDGRLVVASCGATACRTRIVDLTTGRHILVEEPDLGDPIGVADGRLVSYLACRGLPCPIVSIDLANGTRQVVASNGGPAMLIDDGAAVLANAPLERAGEIQFLSLAGAHVGAIAAGEPATSVGPRAAAVAGVEVAPGWLPIVPEALPGSIATAIHPADGRHVSAAETIR